MTEPITRLNTALEGRYRIEHEIGEGGMATVYLAEDLRHERKVALKVLKPELAAVVGAERFLAEIKTTANLQHPHILPLHDSGEAGGFLFFVMPYIDGDTLRDKIDREKQLPVEEALEITKKVASALDYAHGHGVVHRDIKPANILLSERGDPTVADFGIALAVAQAGGGRITETGLSVGTPHYMSPEQATGDSDVDPRTDVYALGCVLYEMLTGEPPYQGATAQAVLARILTDPAPAPTKVRVSIPQNVDATIRRALEKLPADRFDSAEELASALGNPAFRHGDEPAQVVVGRGQWTPVAMATTAATAVLAAALVWLLLTPEPSEPAQRLVLDLEGLVPNAPWGRMVALAPDGSSMVQGIGTGSADSRLALKLRGSTELTPIPGTDIPVDVGFAPDGQRIVYGRGNPSMELVTRPLVGGAPNSIARDLDPGVAGVSWLDDGTLVYEQLVQAGSDTGRRLVRIPATGGEPLAVVFAPEDESFDFLWVHGLPGSRGTLVVGCSNAPCNENADLYALNLETLESEVLVEGVVRAWYAPTGHIIYVSGQGALIAAPFDLASLRVGSLHETLFDGLRVGRGGQGSWADAALGADGTFAYVEGGSYSPSVSRDIVLVDREGRSDLVDPAWGSQAFQSELALSPDDRSLAVSIIGPTGPDLWLKELPSGAPQRLTSDSTINEYRPAFSHDGTTIAYIARDSDFASSVRAVRADQGTSGSYEVVLEREKPVFGVAFTPDDRGLVFREGNANFGEADVGFLDLETGQIEGGLLGSAFNEQGIALSQDGRWLAYVSNVNGRDDVFVCGFPCAGAGAVPVSTNGGIEPVWAHNGRELFYREPAGGMMMVATYASDPTFRVEARDSLFDAGDYEASAAHHAYDVTSDDQRFVMVRDAPPSTLADDFRLVLIQNFFEELRELVPE